MITAPMLAAQADLSKVRYPVLATPKIDGIRCLMVNGKALTRSFKPLPNNYVRNWLEANIPSGVDGELVVPGLFCKVASAFMKRTGEPDFKYLVFDYYDERVTYDDRVKQVREELGGVALDHLHKITLLLPQLIHTESELLAYEQLCVNNRYEGVVFRDPRSPYKCGRSTVREGYMLKLKRFLDSEARVIGFERLEHNTNPATRDAFGHIERSSCQEGRVADNLIGSILVEDTKTGIQFSIGTGFTAEQRRDIFDNWSVYSQYLVKYKHMPHGAKDKPRHPVFLGFRHPEDL